MHIFTVRPVHAKLLTGHHRCNLYQVAPPLFGRLRCPARLRGDFEQRVFVEDLIELAEVVETDLRSPPLRPRLRQPRPPPRHVPHRPVARPAPGHRPTRLPHSPYPPPRPARHTRPAPPLRPPPPHLHPPKGRGRPTPRPPRPPPPAPPPPAPPAPTSTVKG